MNFWQEDHRGEVLLITSYQEGVASEQLKDSDVKPNHWVEVMSVRL
jgi:hypothetical protein